MHPRVFLTPEPNPWDSPMQCTLSLSSQPDALKPSLKGGRVGYDVQRGVVFFRTLDRVPKALMGYLLSLTTK